MCECVFVYDTVCVCVLCTHNLLAYNVCFVYVLLTKVSFQKGLIHANHGLKVMDYLANELRNNTSEVRFSPSPLNM